jgi:hypothetical protein
MRLKLRVPKPVLTSTAPIVKLAIQDRQNSVVNVEGISQKVSFENMAKSSGRIVINPLLISSVLPVEHRIQQLPNVARIVVQALRLKNLKPPLPFPDKPYPVTAELASVEWRSCLGFSALALQRLLSIS